MDGASPLSGYVAPGTPAVRAVNGTGSKHPMIGHEPTAEHPLVLDPPEQVCVRGIRLAGVIGWPPRNGTVASPVLALDRLRRFALSA
jgi:hypothetical protein